MTPCTTSIDFHNRLMTAVETGDRNAVLELITHDDGRKLVVQMWCAICGNVLQGKNEGVADLHLIPHLERILGVNLVSLVHGMVCVYDRNCSTIPNIARLARLHVRCELIFVETVHALGSFVVRRYGPGGLVIFNKEYLDQD